MTPMTSLNLFHLLGRQGIDTARSFNTQLTPDEEQRFQQWARSTKNAAGGTALGDLPWYDARGFWKSGAATAGNGHFTDTFKKPNHETFSNESQYASEEVPGGQWGENTFTPSTTNLFFTPPRRLVDYFKRAEPGYKVDLQDALMGRNPPQPKANPRNTW